MAKQPNGMTDSKTVIARPWARLRTWPKPFVAHEIAELEENITVNDLLNKTWLMMLLVKYQQTLVENISGLRVRGFCAINGESENGENGQDGRRTNSYS
ncbi:hypothetical protein EVAR_77020_1 [Eumeta japonica]|uniref:Uncharacterized protein n=1 Tax=Eumeta variegata TaxID=151549 RepID=A0A4C1SG16_EUMVA|nr:hypothetical protein EVAR_77020_1 [Eumeta japonica]